MAGNILYSEPTDDILSASKKENGYNANGLKIPGSKQAATWQK